MNKKNIITLFYISFGVSLFFFIIDTDEKTVQSFFYGFVICSIYTLLLGISNGYTNDFLNKRYSWTEQTRERAIIGIVAIVLVNVLVSYLCGYINFVLIQKRATLAEFLSTQYNIVTWFTINIALLISAFLHAKGFMEELKKTSKKEVVQQKLIANSANAQFESLKNQLDPHFLFNSLNVLSALIDENPAQAQKFTASMSKIYRYVLEQKDKELVTVAEEIEFAKTYCNLLKTRFEDSVDFVFDIKKEDEQKFVVPLSLQLLLENCIKHNFATSTKPLIIKIYSQANSLSIENNLQKREQLTESAGIGLSNIVQRYSLLTSQNVIVQESNEDFTVKIPTLTHKKPHQMITNNATTSEDIAYQKAVRRVRELKKFYNSLISYCFIIPMLVIINLITSPKDIWFYWPMLGWGIAIIVHGLKIFAIGNNWEERKINEIINKQNNNGK